jgi:hypothetical protein
LKFSEAFNIRPQPFDHWFDPILTVDTPLFLDPFLIYDRETDHFAGSHAEIIHFFTLMFKTIARAGANRTSVSWRRTVDALVFPEVEELCLGYTRLGTKGIGSGRELATLVAEALWEAIQAGVQEIKHFEEVCIIRGGIGADRISDITAALVRYRLAEYTEAICGHYGVPLEAARYTRGRYDFRHERWISTIFQLPRNPYNNKPILLVPRLYLRDLPTINADDFWTYCYSNENATIRLEFSDDITRRVSKQEIIDFARRHGEIRERYLHYRERHAGSSYDFERDPKGIIHWYEETQQYCQNHPVALVPDTIETFRQAIATMVQSYKHYVEDNKGWNLLWNENNTPRREEAAQDLFLGIVKHYCKANNIDISREPNIGRGPVDFKTSRGFNLRALLEVKLAKNSRFWSGLKNQLPKYLEAEEVRFGHFIVIAYTDGDLERLKGIREQVESVNTQTGRTIEVVVVNARLNPISASKL